MRGIPIDEPLLGGRGSDAPNPVALDANGVSAPDGWQRQFPKPGFLGPAILRRIWDP